jgi:hypothetical protein
VLVTTTTLFDLPLLVVTVVMTTAVDAGGREVVAGGLLLDDVDVVGVVCAAGVVDVVFWLGVVAGVSVVGNVVVDFVVTTGAAVTVKRLACPPLSAAEIEGHTRGVRHSSRSSAPSGRSRPVSRSLE